MRETIVALMQLSVQSGLQSEEKHVFHKGLYRQLLLTALKTNATQNSDNHQTGTAAAFRRPNKRPTT